MASAPVATPGDLIFFDWDDPGGYSGPQDGEPNYEGNVEKVENGVVNTVEGDSDDSCHKAHDAVGHYGIYRYKTSVYYKTSRQVTTGT